MSLPAVDGRFLSVKRLILSLTFLMAAVVLARPAPAGDLRLASLPGLKADHVIVEKRKRRLSLWSNGRLLRSYRVALGPTPRGHKRREGDGRTPEGIYILDWRNPNSQFYKSIHISYPGPNDLAHAASRGVDPGGLIMIHGLSPVKAPLGPDHARRDWTQGCIAVTNREIDEIWSLVEDGTPIVIRP